MDFYTYVIGETGQLYFNLQSLDNTLQGMQRTTCVDER